MKNEKRKKRKVCMQSKPLEILEVRTGVSTRKIARTLSSVSSVHKMEKIVAALWHDIDRPAEKQKGILSFEGCFLKGGWSENISQ